MTPKERSDAIETAAREVSKHLGDGNQLGAHVPLKTQRELRAALDAEAEPDKAEDPPQANVLVVWSQSPKAAPGPLEAGVREQMRFNPETPQAEVVEACARVVESLRTLAHENTVVVERIPKEQAYTNAIAAIRAVAGADYGWRDRAPEPWEVEAHRNGGESWWFADGTVCSARLIDMNGGPYRPALVEQRLGRCRFRPATREGHAAPWPKREAIR